MKKRRPPEEAVFLNADDCRQKLTNYFEKHLAENSELVADVESLADFLGTTREGLFSMEQDKIYGFELRKARNRIAAIKKQLAFRGKLPPAVLSFDLKNNHGYRDKSEDAAAGADTVIIKGVAKEWAK
ncbi:MAG: hypothetical protein IJB65_07265 [Clostridia bacterium]|nr:hypothetical protein [Clostridia bacterium]